MDYIFYEHSIPEDLYSHLRDIYQSIYCVKEYFDIFKNYKDINFFVTYSDNPEAPHHILAYVLRSRDINVLNAVFQIDTQTVKLFVRCCFKKYPTVVRICFASLRNNLDESIIFRRIVRESEDICIDLPDSKEQYKALLGQTTRRHLTQKINKLTRSFSDFTFSVHRERKIDKTVFSSIIALHRRRMQEKGKVSEIDSEYEDKLYLLCQSHGFVGTIRCNGKIAAGIICTKVNNHFFSHVIGHDPDYDKLSVGEVCGFLTICKAIDLAGSKGVFHFLWGRSEFKYRLLGRSKPLFSVSMFRSKKYKLLYFFEILNKRNIKKYIRCVYERNYSALFNGRKP